MHFSAASSALSSCAAAQWQEGRGELLGSGSGELRRVLRFLGDGPVLPALQPGHVSVHRARVHLPKEWPSGPDLHPLQMAALRLQLTQVAFFPYQPPLFFNSIQFSYFYY